MLQEGRSQIGVVQAQVVEVDEQPPLLLLYKVSHELSIMERARCAAEELIELAPIRDELGRRRVEAER